MAEDREKFTKKWFDRIDKAQKVKEDWEIDYEVIRNKNYWKGHQLDDPVDQYGAKRVQINKVFPTVRALIPSLYFGDPYAKVVMSPAVDSTPGNMAIDDRRQLIQDMANTFIRDEEANLDEAVHAVLLESQWAFGCCHVMYDNSPSDNPAVEAGPLKEDKDTPTDGAGGQDTTPKRLGDMLGLAEEPPPPAPIADERFYVKRIPARQVLCSADQSGVVGENAWIGYWAVYYLEDIKRSKQYRNTSDLKASSIKSGEDNEDRERTKALSGESKIKLYHIWDQRTKKYYVFAQDNPGKVLKREKYKRLPLKFLRLDVDPDSFYPIPPIFHQLQPQDEVNDSREWLRLNRKGTVPRYTYDKEALEASDMKKLESGDMGTYIPRKANTMNVIEPVQQPNYSSVAMQTLALAKEEFTELSMVSDEHRGVPQSKTATQAKIVDVRSQVQESFDRDKVGKFIADILKEMILQARDKMALTKWILMNADPSAEGYQIKAQSVAQLYRQITSAELNEALTGTSWKIVIDSGSMSPVAEQQERQDWMQTLSLLGNPLMTALLATSDEIRKKTLSLNGIKSAHDQELIAQALKIIDQRNMQMAMAGAGQGPGMASQPGAPPGMGHPAPANHAPGPPGEAPAPTAPPAPSRIFGAKKPGPSASPGQ